MTPRYTDVKLLDALGGFADDHDGRPPTVPEANAREGFPGAQTFVNRFGSWNAAVEAAGLTPRDRRRSDEELLVDLRTVAGDGEHPTYDAVAAREDMAAPQTYENRFGSWTNALDAAGLPAFAANGDATDE